MKSPQLFSYFIRNNSIRSEAEKLVSLSLMALLFVLISTYNYSLQAQCEIDTTITNQEDLNAFFQDNSCEIFNGRLWINFLESGDQMDLSPLSGLTGIDGDLIINVNGLSSFYGLDNLIFVNNLFKIYLEVNEGESVFDVISPHSLEGLNNLVKVGYSAITENRPPNNIAYQFRIENLPHLTDLSGLEALNFVERLNMKDLNNFASFDGLSSLDTLRGIRLTRFPVFESLESFPDVEFFKGGLFLEDVNNLENLNGLEFLPDTLYGLHLRDLPNVGTEDSDLEVLSNVSTIEGTLILSKLPVTNLNGLSNLNYIKSNMILSLLRDLENFDAWSNLTQVGGSITLQTFNSLTSLEGLFNIEDIGILKLSLDSDDTTTMDFSFPHDTLTRLEIYGAVQSVGSNTKHLSGFHNLKYVHQELRLIGFENLESITGFEQLNSVGQDFEFSRMAQIQEMPDFNSLQSIGGDLIINDNDSLRFASAFDVMEYIGGGMTVTENSILENCCELLELYQLAQGDLIFEGNGPFCSLESCGYRLISCFPFIDENENGIWEENEIDYFDLSYQISPQPFWELQDENGFVSFYLEPGDYNVEVEMPGTWELSTNNETFNLNIAGEDSLGFYFGLVPLFDISKNTIDFTMAPALCNDTVNAWIDYKNIGTMTTSGLIAFETAALTNLIESTPPFDYEEDGIYYWNYSDLYPSYSQQISLLLQMPDENEVGEAISFNNTITALGDQDQILDEAFYKHIDAIVCAVDPNDKLVLPAGVEEQNYTLFEDTVLTYTIRFQNTGNYPATDIRIEDTLDLNLDISSFELISASHQVKTSLQLYDRALLFEFDNIYLPDSVNNEPESHGFVKFRIKRKDDLPEFTPIENTGFIYFDFNSAIVTNTVRNTFVSEIPTALTSIISRENKMKISPNPASDYTTLFFDETPEQGSKILVVDIQGEFVREMGEISNKAVRLEADNLREGIYFIRLLGKNGRTMAVQKLLVSP